ncbi:AraC family transcriptional regulator [Arcicella aquatica]|uniref:AraC family transcriptional regulator n=1 Tax=Arcicella aquatica TaxID=217141 RepID=A0ABU5QML5_9BACT|nr:AraC family transcriptional regulator [Arcicella aquatica]MEA5258297.1 AraC family transcriptional regulator [Arcicella aquatica]
MATREEGFLGQRTYIMPHELLSRVIKHPLVETLYITDIGYYLKANNHACERKNGCGQHILIYCLEGEGWYMIDNQKYLVNQDHFFIIPANLPHSYGANINNPWTIYWVHFVGTLSAHYINFLFENTKNYSPVALLPNNQRLVIFDDIISHIEMSFNDDNIVYANAQFSHFLTTFKASVFNPNPQHTTETDPISKVIAYMKKHLTETLTLEQLADVAGMSASHFSAVFRQKVQSSPINFFTFLKVQQACSLLEHSKLRVKEIAYTIGYNDPYHFSRIFTTVMGISPREFRKKIKE